MKEDMSAEERDSARRRAVFRRFVLPAMALTAFTLAVFFAVFLNRRELTYRIDPAARDGAYVMGAAPGAVKEPEYFRIQLNSRPAAASGSKLPFLIGNPEENEADMQVTITLDGTGEEIFSSSLLAPGEREPYGELNRPLKPGLYRAAADIAFFDPETGKAEGSIEAELEITIEE